MASTDKGDGVDTPLAHGAGARDPHGPEQEPLGSLAAFDQPFLIEQATLTKRAG